MRLGYFPVRYFQTLERFHARFPLLVLLSGFLCYDTGFAADPGSETAGTCQVVKPGEVPAGMDEAAWTKIQAQLIYGAEKKLTAGDGVTYDSFGWSVAVAGDVALVGAEGKENWTGAAYVFERNAGGTNAWGQVKKLTAADGELWDYFGGSVSVAGDVALVGAPYADPGSGTYAGAVYVFERNAGGANAWGQVKKLTAADGAANDLFGYSVSVAGDVALVGAAEKENWTGAAYVFERNAGGANAWGQVRKLTAADGASWDYFGGSVSVAGNVALVGAAEKENWTGAAYVFERNAGGANAWGQVRKLTAADGASWDYFGGSVSVAGNVALVGAAEKENWTGAAYVFERNAGGTNAWGQVRKLTAADAASWDYFGSSVSVAGNVALVGAEGADGNENGTGAAYVFERNAGGTNAWGQVRKLTAPDGAEWDSFGGSVSVAGSVALVGAEGADGNENGTGAAYVFDEFFSADLDNLALTSRGSTITGSNGAKWTQLIDGVTTGYASGTGFGYTLWTNVANAPGSMILDLKGPCTISSLKLLLWDLDSRYHQYKIETSFDDAIWTPIVDRTATTNRCRGWQEIDFNPAIQARYLRLTGTYNSANAGFCVVEWEVYGILAAMPVILTSANEVAVPEGSTATFQVKLDRAPVSPTTVSVSRVSGDTDITIQSGGRLVFNDANWNTEQTVTLQAAEDVDMVNSAAVIRCSAPGLARKDMMAIEQDNDRVINLALASRGSTITGSNGGKWTNLIDGVTSGYDNKMGFGYTLWTNVANAPGSMTLDLKSPCTISSMRLLLWDLDSRYHQYKIETSMDNATWTTIVDRTAVTNRCRSWQDISFNPTIPARYLRLTGTYNSANAGFCVVEWKVYGTVGAGAGTSFLASTSQRNVSVLNPIEVRTSDPEPDTNGWKAVDGNPETFWQGGAEAGGWWLALTYGQQVKAKDVQVQWMGGSSTGLVLLGSKDAEQWYELGPLLKEGPVSFGYLWLVLPEIEAGTVPKVSEIWVDPAE